MRISNAARQVGLFRLLLVVLALAVVVVTVEGRQRELAPEAVLLARWLIAGVATIALGLILAVPLTRRAWQIVLHLVFDLLWIGVLAWITGGVASPAIPLFFAVILINALALPGVAPFVMPAIGGLILGVIATLSLANITPLTPAYLQAYPGVADINRIVGQLAIQLAGLFLVDLLGQLLARRLGEQRLYTRELLDQLGEGVIAIDHQGAITYANDEAVRLLQLPVTDLTGSPLASALADPHLDHLRARLEGIPGPGIERLRLADGRQLVARISDLINKKGTLLGRTLLVADETRVRLLEENAHRAQHLANLGEMAAGIAHEIRNPLASLRGCAQEIAAISAQRGDDDARALTTIMLGESDRLARIVDEFLEFSRMRRPDLQDVDLGHLAQDIQHLILLRQDLPGGLVMSVTVENDCPPIHADPGQIRQVLLNLLNNAIDAVRGVTSPHVQCSIRLVDDPTRMDTSAIEIRIRDNGVGIPKEIQPHLFTPFFSTKAKGTGLGLALVSRIIREHEGILDLQSQPGVGTAVTIHLPARSVTRQFRRVAGGGGIIPAESAGDGRSFPSDGAG